MAHTDEGLDALRAGVDFYRRAAEAEADWPDDAYRCLHFGSRLNRLRQDYRVVIQVNAETLLRPASFLMRRWIRQAMENEWIDVVASDAHDVEHRPCLLGQCAAHIENFWGRAAAERVCSITPRKLINY